MGLEGDAQGLVALQKRLAESKSNAKPKKKNVFGLDFEIPDEL